MAKFVSVMGEKKGGVNYKIPDGKKNAGQNKVLLTPAGKRAKFNAELENGIGLTVNGEVKYNEDGSMHYLSNKQKAYRKGYLQAQNEQRAIYAKQHAKKQ